ncbi:MAG TPA: HAD family phosphatase [Flavobacteriaceae bacterium]|nr:HAD family phosphatase [Flavobacteriaceae bacterium]
MIDTLIFDFGNVFIDLNHDRAYQKLNALGYQGFSEEMQLQNLQFEKGLISTSDFIEFYRPHFAGISEEELIATWNAVIGDFPKHRLEFLQKIADSKQYKLILLSNTNALHIEHIAAKTSFYNDFIACFDRVYFSHEMNLRKPDPEIYRAVLEQENLNPESCFFIDDLSENTKAAEQLGIKSWNLQPGKEEVVELFTLHQKLLKDFK